jgi:hypothetical protein
MIVSRMRSISSLSFVSIYPAPTSLAFLGDFVNLNILFSEIFSSSLYASNLNILTSCSLPDKSAGSLLLLGLSTDD